MPLPPLNQPAAEPVVAASLADVLQPEPALARALLPQYEEASLQEQGIRKVSGDHLIVYTDLAAEKVRPALRLLNQLYPFLVKRFGEPSSTQPPQTWKITGHVMADRELFRTMDLLPDDLPSFPAGISRDKVFWILDQVTDYYRNHLLLHEATHCFMDSALGGRGPAWFAEGNAELMATHRLVGSEMRFAEMPQSKNEVERLGRIEMVQDAVAESRGNTVKEVMSLPYALFDDDNTAYAWAWALCAFLDGHPRYQQRFGGLHRWVLEPDFNLRVRRLYADDWDELTEEFQLFAANLSYGYDLKRCTLDFRAGEPIPENETREVVVASDRGWSNTGLRVEAGSRYELRAVGRFSIADEPRVWYSDAGGLSFRYAQGKPIGRLVASIRDDRPTSRSSMLDVLDVGLSSHLAPERSGTLYLRINDDWGQLGDNRGELRVTITKKSTKSSSAVEENQDQF